MRIPGIAVTVLLAALSGCSVDPTPREYIDRHRPEEPQVPVRDQIDDRVRLVVQSLAAGDPSGARAALAPAPDVRAYGPGPRDRFEGGPQVDSLLELIATATQGTLRLQELEVDAEPRGTVAWFAALLVLERPDQSAPTLRATGVFRLREGEWELNQISVIVTRDGAAMEPYPAGSPAPEGGE